MDRFLERITRQPALPRLRRRRRIQRDVALSARFQNPLSAMPSPGSDATRQAIETSYQALCALAHDLGAPRADHQTPYEFIQSFPKELEPLREEAVASGLVTEDEFRELVDPKKMIGPSA